MAYDGSLIFDTKIDKKGFNKGVKGLANAGKQSFGAVTKVIAGVGVAIAGLGVASAMVGAKFEKSMSQVAATMGMTAEDINKGSKSFEMLEKAAKDAGKTTKFSASQSAEALNYLALAGYSAEKSVEALPTVLNLAAAGGLELGYASDLVTDSMSALGLETDELSGFVDQLAKTSQKSNTSVGQLGEAILGVGGLAKNLAGGTVELNTQLGILADVGLKGSEGGTKLRNVILALGDSTGKTAEGLSQLGISAYDMNGDLRGTNEIFKDINTATAEMTTEERSNILGNMFNKRDIVAVDALLSASGDRFDILSGQIANADGAAKIMAETMEANLMGSVTVLKSSLEGLGIEVYQNMDSPLKDVTNTLTGYVGQITGAITAQDDARASMEELGYSSKQIEQELGEIPDGFEGAVAVIGEVLADIITKFAEYGPKVIESAVDLIESFIEGLTDNKEKIGDGVVEIITSLINAFMDLYPKIILLGIDLLVAFMEGMLEEMPELIKNAGVMIDTLLDAITENLPLILDMGIELLLMLIKGLIDSLPKLMEAVPEIIDAIVEVILENLPEIIDMGIELIIALIDGYLSAIPKIIETVPKIISGIVDTLMAHDWKATAVKIMTTLIDGLLSMIPTILISAGKLMVSLKDGLEAGLSAIGQVGVGLVEGLWKGIDDKVGWIVDKVRGFGRSVVGGIKKFFGIMSPSTLMAKYGKNIVEGLAIGIKENASDAEKAMYDMAQDIVKEYDRLGDAVMTGLKNRYREEEQAQLETLKKHTENIREETDRRITQYNREFDAKLRVLGAETSEEMKAIQKQIDAIREKTRKENEELKEQEYNNKITLLNKEILEATSNDERIRLQAELNGMKEEKQRENILAERDAQVESLRDEMDRVQQQGDDKKAELEAELKAKLDNEADMLSDSLDYYDDQATAIENHYLALNKEEAIQAEARRLILAENNDELVTLLGTYNSQWQNAGQSFGESLLTGLNSMKASIQSEVDEILSLISQADKDYAVGVNGGGGGLSISQRNANDEILQAKRDFDDAQKKGDKEAMARAETMARKAREAGGTIGSDVTLDEAEEIIRKEKDANDDILQAKRDFADAQNRGDERAMDRAREKAKDARKVGGTIGADVTLEDATGNNNDVSKNVDAEIARVRASLNLGSGVYNNSMVQNITIVSPENTPSENARQIKNVGRDLSFGY